MSDPTPDELLADCLDMASGDFQCDVFAALDAACKAGNLPVEWDTPSLVPLRQRIREDTQRIAALEAERDKLVQEVLTHTTELYRRSEEIAALETQIKLNMDYAALCKKREDTIGDLRVEIVALEAEREVPILLDCLAGKLTSFDAICGYVCKLETENAKHEKTIGDLRETINGLFHEVRVLKAKDRAATETCVCEWTTDDPHHAPHCPLAATEGKT